MKVSQIMSKNVVSVAMDDPLSRVKELFEETKFHHLLVVENGKLFGVISDRDLLKSISPNVDTVAATSKDLATLNKKAHQVLTRNPITLGENASVRDAIGIFNEHSISCIPIINEQDRPVGVLSWRDIMRELGKAK